MRCAVWCLDVVDAFRENNRRGDEQKTNDSKGDEWLRFSMAVGMIFIGWT